ncbi:MAG: hypothetical protein AB8G23_07830 [Myxococcota bacterium]
MLRHEKSAPIWLFSFVDLAFLLLIAFTQIGQDTDPLDLDVAEIEIPRIGGVSDALTREPTATPWQLRIHPTALLDASGSELSNRTPFELIEPGRRGASSGDEAGFSLVSAEDLAAHLELLRTRQTPRPNLAPHRDSRAEDLLVAVDLLEDVWQAGRGVTVTPTQPDVASSAAEAVRGDR